MHELSTLDNRIKPVEEYPKIGTQLIEMPRYKEFLDIMIKISGTQVSVIEIAGNKHIQLKIRYKKTKENILEFDFDTGKKLYSWQLKTQPDYVYAVVKVPVSQLKNILNYCRQQDVTILYIHDF